MKNTFRHLMTALLAASAAVAMASCEKGPSPENPADDEWSIVIEGAQCATKAAPTVMHRNEDAVLKATILRNGEPYDYDGIWKWESTDNEVVYVSGAEEFAYLHASNSGEMKWKVRAVSMKERIGRELDTDGPIKVPSTLVVNVTETTYYDQVVTTLDFDAGGEPWVKPLGLMFVYSAYSGTPTHYAAANAGQSYSQFLSGYSLPAKNMTVMKRDITGSQHLEFVSSASGQICFYKRMAVNVVQNETGFDEIEFVYDRDYTMASDDFLSAVPQGGGNPNTHKPQCLGTYYYVIGDYGWAPNRNNGSNHDRIATLTFNGLESAGGSFSASSYPVGMSVKTDVKQLTSGEANLLESWTVDVAGKRTELRSMNNANHGNGFSFDSIGTDPIFFSIPEGTKVYAANGDYYILKFGNRQ